MGLIWSHWVFVSVNAISLPLYLLIIIVCAKEWKRNVMQRTFYLLTISQGVMDIFVMVNYMVFAVIRQSDLVNNLFWSNQNYYLASWCFCQLYVTVFMRCFGALLLSFQRYISLCKSGHYIEQVINSSHRCILPILQWTVPLVYSLPIFTLAGRTTFENVEQLDIVAEKRVITLATLMAVLFVSVVFIACSVCYTAILRFLIRNRSSRSEALKRERHLYIQMLGLFLGLLLFFIYNILQFIFSLSSNDGPIYTMRVIFPIISCFFSYVNAWMMLILNGDIRKKIGFLLGRRQRKDQFLGEMIWALPLCVLRY